MLLGCIGDDFTGSSDLANTLSKNGMRVTQYTGVPDKAAAPEVEAGVVALKSRSVPVEEAVRLSLNALHWLRDQGCMQFFFKYCSTFDSTPDGNIGPVAQALAEELQAHKVIVCPAFPGTGRSIYQGHLFVGDRLLNESGMEHHPLTPMLDSDIRRWLRPQTDLSVGHVAASDVFAGHAAIATALAREDAAGHRLIVVDALEDRDLYEIGQAAADLPLITGGSGVAVGLPANFKAAGAIEGQGVNWAGQAGPCVALSGSCSAATRAQIAHHATSHPCLELSAAQIISGEMTPEAATTWAMAADGIPLIYSSADPEAVTAVQQKFGREIAANAIEGFFAETARRLVGLGVTRVISAGGETSGAIVEGLGLQTLEIGPEIDPGVPALRAGDALVIALKSGNFGAENFFSKAARILGGIS
ncbi:MAG: 3-oxo-tetronate kinase [Pseudomonadota bacterium]